ncbi:MAG: nitroreductase family protein, partial [Deltaproteobacteria bacterium]|nr:nitroreductase family protein [Deltaproteobacteria bacterium]
MMQSFDTRVDPLVCTGCGLCVPVCPSQALSMVDGKAARTGDCNLGCGHCMAACPVDALAVPFPDPDALDLATVDWDRGWLAPGRTPVPDLVQLMGSRRSCRTFLPDPVPPAVLDDLVRIGTLAPSGTNSQRWTFTILPDRPSVERLGEAVSDFFRRLNRLARNPLARTASRLLD